MGGCTVIANEHGRYTLSRFSLANHTFPHSANCFQYVARGGGKYKVMIYNFTSKCLNL